jgi:hypothetical protein
MKRNNAKGSAGRKGWDLARVEHVLLDYEQGGSSEAELMEAFGVLWDCLLGEYAGVKQKPGVKSEGGGR